MKGQIRQLLSLGAIYSVGGLLEKGVHFVFLPVYTYYLNPEEYGIIAMMMLVVNLIYPLFQTPAAAGVERHYYAPEHRQVRGELIFLGLGSILIQAAVFAALFFVFSRRIGALVLDSAAFAPVVRVFAVVLLCEPISQYFLMLIRLQKKAFRFLFISLSSAVLFSIVVIYLLVAKDLGYMALAYGRLFHSGYISAVGLCLLFREMKVSFRLSYLKPVMAYGYPLVIPAVSFFLITSSDRFVLKIFSSLEIVGLFVFASQFTLIFKTLLLVPLKNALGPMVFEMEQDPGRIRDFLYRSAGYFCMVSFMIWLLITLFSKELVQMMGRNPSYWSAWPIVPIITLSSLILGFNAYANKGIVMAKKTSLITFTYLFGCGANIALNFLFIPLWGAIGAAVATCAALVLFTGLNAYYSKRLYSLSFDLGKIARIAITAGALAVVGLMSNAFGPVAAAAVKLVLLASFPVLLFLTRAVSREELDACRQAVLDSRTGRFLCAKLFRSGPMEG